jgi:hypothetical protein
MPAKKKVQSSEFNLFLNGGKSALALAKETTHRGRASFSRAGSKKENRFESSKLSSHQATNKKFRDLNAQSSARGE